MATLHGKNAHVYLQGSGSDAVPVSESNQWSLSFDYDLEVDSAFGDTWETNVRGLSKYTGTIQGNFDTASAVLFDAYSALTPRKMYLYPDRASTGRYYYGTVWPKLDAEVPMGVAKTTVNFTGDGQGATN